MCSSEAMCNWKLFTPWSIYRKFTVPKQLKTQTQNQHPTNTQPTCLPLACSSWTMASPWSRPSLPPTQHAAWTTHCLSETCTPHCRRSTSSRSSGRSAASSSAARSGCTLGSSSSRRRRRLATPTSLWMGFVWRVVRCAWSSRTELKR